MFVLPLLFSCGDDVTKNVVGETVKEELPKQPNCGDIDGIEIKSYSDVENIPSDYTGLTFECRGDKVKKLRAYKDGLENGLRRTWYDNGQIKRDEKWFGKESRKYAKQMGFQREWYENGQLRVKYTIIDNGGSGKGVIEDGPLVEWYKNGQMKNKRNYKNGELLSEKCFDEDGKEIECDSVEY